MASNRADLFWKAHSKHKPGQENFFSQDFKDIVQSLLQLDPQHRPSLSEVKGHPWFKGDLPTKEEVFNEFSIRSKKLDQIMDN